MEEGHYGDYALFVVKDGENIEMCHKLQGSEYQVGAYFLDNCTVIDRFQLLNSTSDFSRSVLDSHWNPLAGATSGYLTQQTVGYLKRQGFIIYGNTNGL